MVARTDFYYYFAVRMFGLCDGSSAVHFIVWYLEACHLKNSYFKKKKENSSVWLHCTKMILYLPGLKRVV